MSRIAVVTREQPTTELDIGDRQTRVVVHRGDPAEVSVALSLGVQQQLADGIFGHEPPRPAELESAIDAVEDQVMKAVDVVPTGSSLVVLGPVAGQLAGVCRADDGGATVSVATIEGLFQRLASESLGNPAARHGLPAGNAFVVGVLIVREFMHHLGFESVTIQAAQPPSVPSTL
jgi:hypothetical protein